MSPVINPSGGGGSGGSQPIQKLSVPISSAQLLAMHSNPPEIISAPASGSMIALLGALLMYSAGGTPYTPFGGIGLMYAGGSVFNLTFGVVLSESTDFIGAATGLSADGVAWLAKDTNEQTFAAVEAKAVVLTMQNSDPTGGDGTAVVNVLYSVESLP